MVGGLRSEVPGKPLLELFSPFFSQRGEAWQLEDQGGWEEFHPQPLPWLFSSLWDLGDVGIETSEAQDHLQSLLAFSLSS